METVGKALGKAVDKVTPDKPAKPLKPEHDHDKVVYSELPQGEGLVAYVDLDCLVGVEQSGGDTLVHLCSGHTVYTVLPPEEVLALLDDYEEDDLEV